MLKNNTPYKELGPDFFELRRKTEIVKKTVKRLETLGFSVTVEQSIKSLLVFRIDIPCHMSGAITDEKI